MEPLKLPDEDEIWAVYQQGQEATVQLVVRLIQVFEERLQKLEDQVAKNSSNSGKPPSSDGLGKKPKSLRHKSGKKSGGQAGHPAGSTLKTVEKPDHIETHVVKPCRHCLGSLEDVAPKRGERRQVFDVPRGTGKTIAFHLQSYTTLF